MNKPVPHSLIRLKIWKQDARGLRRQLHQFSESQSLFRVVRLIKGGLKHHSSPLISIVCLLAEPWKDPTRLTALKSAPPIMQPIALALDSACGRLIPEELLSLAKVTSRIRQCRKGVGGNQKGSPGKLLHLMMILEVSSL
jgi:hypothetical protein